jgi:hypothetical protein
MTGIFEGLRQGWVQGRTAPDRRTPANGAAGNSKHEEQSLAEVTVLAEQLQARVRELEAELADSPASIFAEVLRLPGVKKQLVSRFHPDKPDVNEAERQWLTEAMQKINAAYEALEKKGGL